MTAALFIDASAELASVTARIRRDGDIPLTVNRADEVPAAALPSLCAGTAIVLNDHTFMPTAAMRGCPDVRDVVFLGTGARSYMDVEALAALGIVVHTIRGYGDTAVAEHAIGLMFAAAREVALMDRAIRAGGWPRREGVQLRGKTLGLIGFGGIGAEVARIAAGVGMRVVAWNRTPRTAAGVAFLELDAVLAASDVLSLHLLLTDETRGLLSEERLARLRPGAILVNTARGALVDEAALVAGLRAGRIGHAALDVFTTEPLPPDHMLTGLRNVTLSAHSAFRTPEASETLMRRALDIATGLAAEASCARSAVRATERR